MTEDYEVVNNTIRFRKDDEEVEFILDIYQKIARHLWAIIVLLAQLHTGTKPNWRKK